MTSYLIMLLANSIMLTLVLLGYYLYKSSYKNTPQGAEELNIRPSAYVYHVKMVAVNRIGLITLLILICSTLYSAYKVME